tara:strand:- start:822 stop:1091 length:270 start_codon:yes stop_codon:yes gene_type:complete
MNPVKSLDLCSLLQLRLDRLLAKLMTFPLQIFASYAPNAARRQLQDRLVLGAGAAAPAFQGAEQGQGQRLRVKKVLKKSTLESLFVKRT